MRRPSLHFSSWPAFAADRLLLAGVGAAALTACSSSFMEPITPAAAEAYADEFQWAAAGSAVAAPPAVRVLDAGGQPLPGVVVMFTVASGGGAVAGTSAVTGADGTAAAGAWTLGPLPGQNTLAATVAGLAPVTFVAVGLPGAAVAFDEVVSIQNALTGLETPTYALIDDAGAWAATWSAIYSHHAPSQVPPLPAVDFAADVVLLAGAGLRGAQGFSYTIEHVRADAGTLRVYVLEHYPHCGTLPAMSAPVHAVRVPRGATTAEFTLTVRQPTCS
jgi:hypothetical protein